MKVWEAMALIEEISNVEALLRKWKHGEITEQKQIDALAECIAEHLDDYMDTIRIKEVK